MKEVGRLNLPCIVQRNTIQGAFTFF